MQFLRNSKEIEQWVRKRNGKMGLYYTLNRTCAGPLLKPRKTDIITARGLHADIDPAYDKPPQEEQCRLSGVIDVLVALGTLAPSFIVHSGNGIQVIWCLDQVTTGTEEERGRIERLNRKLEAALGAGGTHNIDRLLRLPGTINLPNKKKSEAGRVPTPARLLALNGVRTASNWYEQPLPAPRHFELTDADAIVAAVTAAFRRTDRIPTRSTSARSKTRERTTAPGKEAAYITVITAQWPRIASCASRSELAVKEPDLQSRLSRVIGKSKTLSRRLDGANDDLRDKSRSGWDQSIVTLLRQSGFNVIETCLLTWMLGAETRLGRGRDLDARQLARSWIVAEGPTARATFSALSVQEITEIEAAAASKMEANAPGWVKELNKRFALVRGYAVVEFDERGQILATMTPTEFKEFYNKDRVQVGFYADGRRRWKGKGTAWLESSYRRDYHRIGILSPSEEMPTDYNLWRGLKLSGKSVPWPTIEDYLLTTLCGGDRAVYEWLIRWIARIVQYPLEPGETGVLIKGQQGTGKSTFYALLELIFGENLCLHATDERTVFGQFNMILEGKVIVFLDEAAFGFNKSLAPKIKGLLTEPTIHVEEKYVRRRSTRNIGHYVIVSNSEAPLPLDPDDRRFLVLTASPERCRDHAYFRRVRQAFQSDELHGFIHRCQMIDLTGFNHREPPFTNAKASVTAATADPEIEFWMEALESGKLPALFGTIGVWETNSQEVPKTDLVAAFIQFAKNRREPIRPARYLLATIKAHCPGDVGATSVDRQGERKTFEPRTGVPTAAAVP